MTKKEAIQAMEEGNKVTHKYFDLLEWMKLTPSGLYQFEDGVVCSNLLFWQDRKEEYWETGWKIFNEK